MTRRGLQIFLTLLGSVAFVAGSLSIMFGAYIVPDHGAVIPSVDSEMRFYAAWYAAAGIIIVRTVPHVEAAGRTIRAVAAAFFIAGCGRLISVLVAGTPHVTQLVLMAVELVLPFVLVPWQSTISRRGASTPPTESPALVRRDAGGRGSDDPPGTEGG